jgi:hypothetical protein
MRKIVWWIVLTTAAACPRIRPPKIPEPEPGWRRTMIAMRIAWVALAVWVVLGGTAFADTVKLTSGDKLEGTIIEKNDEGVVLDHPVLGRLTIPAADIKPPDPITPGLFGTSFLRGFDKALAAGFSGSSGKSRDMSMNVDFSLKREIVRHRMAFVARYYFSSDEGTISDNQLDSTYIHDFLIPDADWFPFLSPHYRYDAEQDWNHRLGLRAGIGYQFFEDDTWNVRGRLGGGVNQTLTDDRGKEVFRGSTDPPAPFPTRTRYTTDDPIRTEYTGVVGLHLGWVMIEGVGIDWTTFYEPDFGDTPNFRLESRAEWTVKVGYVEGLSFRLGGSYIYDGHESDSNRNDRKYYGNIVYDF